jgi:hypothetical protein
MKLSKFVLVVIILVSCKSQNSLKEISYNDIFSISKERYLVCFYSSTCKACSNVIEILNKRYQIKKYEGFLVKTDDLSINFSTEKIMNIGVRHVSDIKLYSLPYLIFIKEKRIEKELYGYTEIHKENLYIFFE